ncbi:hypothetical protein [Bradyrhizobium neotropicale]|uniref:DUF4405 domain-containing protein n=1 Tax=Bradyrhizobium neotropicale TaxID=1497615 RepID=A0A176ZD15_9BRAD|nr:hypothetical protein [Bradyrhizobium neotropicale]OAF17723.1 hypothetical protein AXW67_07370 [Bradyrhizobium neotropicale]
MRLGPWQKTAVLFTVTMVGLSGLLWFIFHDLLADDWSEPARILLMLHGVTSYALLVIVGSLLPLHVRAGWLRRQNIITGVAVTATMAILSVTALVLYYGGEETQAVAKWVHLAVGVGCIILFPAHAFMKSSSRESAAGMAIEEETRRLTVESR